MEQNHPQVVRPLGKMELYSSTRHSLGIYRRVILSARYVDPPTANPDGVIFDALGQLVSKHPMLRVGILGEATNTAQFSYISEIDLRKHVTFRTLPNEEDYEIGLEAVHAWCHDQTWDEIETQPPWSLIVVRPEITGPNDQAFEDILFSFHHSLMDGTGGKNFHEQLVATLNQTASDVAPVAHPYVLRFPDAPTLPESQEDLIPYSIGARFMGRTLWKEMVPSFLKPSRRAIWAGEPIDFSRPHKARVLSVDLPMEVCSSLLIASRDHSASITSLLHALCLTSLAHRLTAKEAPAFSAGTPINARPYMAATANPDLKETLRVCISTMSHDFSAAKLKSLRKPDANLDALIWHHAKAIKDQIRARMKTLPADDRISLLKYISDWAGWWMEKDGQRREVSWELSNVGVLHEEQKTSMPN